MNRLSSLSRRGRCADDPETCVAALRMLFPTFFGVAAERARWPVDLPEEEARAVAGAVETRKAEFAAGRRAARRALADVGFPRAVLPVVDRMPRWPRDAIGSISHAGGVAIAVAACIAKAAAVGVDIERTAAVAENLWPEILTRGERCFVDGLPATERRAMATVIFSIKEAYYKFQFPHTRRWVDFHDVEIDIDRRRTGWRARARQSVHIAGRLQREVEGRYHVGEDHTMAGIHASASIPAAGAEPWLAP